MSEKNGRNNAFIPIYEENYEERMRDEVTPYLSGRKKERWLTPSGDLSGIVRTREKHGGKLHVCVYTADAPRGIVVISHGFSETAFKYEEMVYYFLRERYHVYIPEHCGHGKSYRMTKEASLVHVDRWERYVKDFLRVSWMAHREYPELPVFLYAHSMGGAIAAAAAARDPGLYDKVILSAPMIRPLTGNVPWRAAAAIAKRCCVHGRGGNYVAGQHPYDGKENFAASAGLSPKRFERYYRMRLQHEDMQMWGASYRWLYEAARMSHYLLKTAWKDILAPVLLFQAENDTLVSGRAQEKFAARLNRYGDTVCRVVRVPDTKHEIFSSRDETLLKYWNRIFEFLGRGENYAGI